MDAGLVKSLSIANLVNQRAGVVARLRQALDLIAEAEQLARSANVGFPRLVLDPHFSRRGGTVIVTSDFAASRAEVEAVMLRCVDGQGWRYLLSESGLRSFMNAGARSEFDKQLDSGALPELNLANIEATFGALYADRQAMFELGVIECFRRLSWCYKTNNPFRFGKRFILSYLFTYGSPNHRSTDELDDLSRVLHVLDGKPEPDHRSGLYPLIWSARDQGQVEAPYFRVKWFKKGSGHVTFTRLDLVDRMNQILAKYYPGALPAPR